MCGAEDQATKAETISRVQCFELVVDGMPDTKKASERRGRRMKDVDVRRGHGARTLVCLSRDSPCARLLQGEPQATRSGGRRCRMSGIGPQYENHRGAAINLAQA